MRRHRLTRQKTAVISGQSLYLTIKEITNSSTGQINSEDQTASHKHKDKCVRIREEQLVRYIFLASFPSYLAFQSLP